MNEKVDLIRQLKQHDGWKLIETFLHARIGDHKNQLLNCPIEKVQTHRDKIQAYESVFAELETIIREGEGE